MSNTLEHKITEDGTHEFDFQNLKIHLTDISGANIGSEGGLRFTMSLKESMKGKEVLTKVDEFIVYPDAIDWKNGGKMKPEFEKRIKEAHESRGESLADEADPQNEEKEQSVDE